MTKLPDNHDSRRTMDPSMNRLEVRVQGKTFECHDGDVIGREGTIGQDVFSGIEGLAECAGME